MGLCWGWVGPRSSLWELGHSRAKAFLYGWRFAVGSWRYKSGAGDNGAHRAKISKRVSLVIIG
jgi:hypothetical protein